jgi:hypothetical protein
MGYGLVVAPIAPGLAVDGPEVGRLEVKFDFQ